MERPPWCHQAERTVAPCCERLTLRASWADRSGLLRLAVQDTIQQSQFDETMNRPDEVPELARIEERIGVTVKRIDRLKALLAAASQRKEDALPLLRSTLVCLQQSLAVFERHRAHLLMRGQYEWRRDERTPHAISATRPASVVPQRLGTGIAGRGDVLSETSA